MVRLEGIQKRFDGIRAVESLVLELSPERTLALIGPSGCGKTTLLRLIAGLITPDSGRVLIDGTEMTPATARRLRRAIGYVIQEGGLFPHLTARQNVALAAKPAGWAAERLRDRIRELADLVRLLPDALERYPAQLSGGQKQRVGLMRGLLLDPDLLLLDEPLAALDPMVRSQLQEDLKRIFQALRKTVLLVTHDMGEAAFLGDEIALMRDGRVVQRGAFSDLVRHPAEPFVTEFIRAQRPPRLEGEEGGH